MLGDPAPPKSARDETTIHRNPRAEFIVASPAFSFPPPVSREPQELPPRVEEEPREVHARPVRRAGRLAVAAKTPCISRDAVCSARVGGALLRSYRASAADTSGSVGRRDARPHSTHPHPIPHG